MSHVTSLHNSDAFTLHSVPGDGDCLNQLRILLHNILNVERNYFINRQIEMTG